MTMAGPRSRSDSVRRARGFTVGEEAKSVPLRRWDGLSKTCREWDSLRRDPEIWERNGNCLVHLYAKGESKRGPSFKLPLSALLSASCFPLIERFSVLEGLNSKTAKAIEKWDQQHPRSTVELYIPAPPSATETQARHYYVAIRNLIAWNLKRPMVGEQLGSALIGLLHSMHEFRSVTDTNVDDLMRYLRQAGYTNMAEEPGHALAILQLAEAFQIKELYAQSFAHCVGMQDRLSGSSEYQLTSAVSRKLIRKARIDMNAMLLQTTDMLTTFLDEELSEAHLAIPSGTRAHLERFRSFLLSFYTSKMGYYPPKSFSSGLLRAMAKDFEALYKLLVDSNYTCSDTIPSTAAGGICIEQLVQSFDDRHKLKPLAHPLPRLPQIDSRTSFRLMSWLPFSGKANASHRQVTHAALIKASNWTESVFKNDLVRAYRAFEEQSVLAPNKADKSEKVSVVDARKVRWIMIYAIYQILRRATQHTPGVQQDDTTYHMAVPIDNLPPWKESHEINSLLRRQTDLITSNGITASWRDRGLENSAGKIEIKPDIDYFALTRGERRSSMSNVSDSPTTNLSRSSSFSISLKRNSTIRRSLRRFRTGSQSESHPVTVTSPSKPTYREIVVQGYGNGTHDVIVEPDEGLMMKTGNLASRSDSTASSQTNSSSIADSVLDSMSSTIDTLPSTTAPTPTSAVPEKSLELELMLARWGPQDKTPMRMSSITRSASETAISRDLPNVAIAQSISYTKVSEKKVIVQRKRRSLEPTRSTPAPAPDAVPRRYSMLSDLRRKSGGSEGRSVPVRIRENDIDEEPWASHRKSDDWSIFMGNTAAKTDVNDAWAQYTDLGGLTDMR